jgi:lactate dehydrogenase-like 2-hydroxyacid dehydrogenase
MSKPEILMLGSYPQWDMEPLARDYIVHRYWEAADKPSFVAKVANNIRAIGTRGDITIPADLYGKLPNLGIITCYGVGLDGIDLAYARSHNIVVTNTPGVLHEDVADIALLLMLAVARRFPQAERHLLAGRWAAEPYPIASRVHGKRLGLIGMGAIGQAIARRAVAFNMPVAYTARHRHDEKPFAFYATPSELAANCDFLVAACTGGKETAGIVDAHVLQALGSTGYFINVARGSVADESALLEALEKKAIRGAGLDVYYNEPAIDGRFLKLDNVALQPHVGSATEETRRAMGQLVRDNLAAHFAGKPLLTPVK